MRLKLSNKYGQRDERWKNIILGYNTDSKYTIGLYGCLITSLGNYIGKNPQEVNEILKANNGFAAGSGNFVWSKCTALGLNQVYSSPYYSGLVTSQGLNKMRTLLDEGRPLLTHVDFDPRDPDDDQHWLLVTGYEDETFFAFDPWSATDITLDVYGGAARAVYEFKAYDKILPLEEEDALVACMKDREKFWKERDEAQKKLEEKIKECGELNTKYNLLLGEKENLDKQLTESLINYANLQKTSSESIEKLNWQIQEQTAKIEDLESQLLNVTTQLTSSDNEKQKKINFLTTENEGLKKRVEELQKELNLIPRHKVLFKLFGIYICTEEV